jgi:putative glutamine amidotransferase
MTPPRIVVTLAAAADHADPEYARRRNGLYLEAVRRHGGEPVAVDARTPASEVAAALADMDGLLLTGGADIDPARYGRPNQGSVEISRERDELEARAFAAAEATGAPVLGICRGLQAINVFSGGTLLQHVEGHQAAGWSKGSPATHPMDLVAGTRLASVLDPEGSSEPLVVNAFHHQGIRADDLAPGLLAAGWADSSAGPLVEGLEAPGDRFVVGVQCHPERTDSTPAAFERLFAAFVAAAASSGSPHPSNEGSARA